MIEQPQNSLSAAQGQLSLNCYPEGKIRFLSVTMQALSNIHLELNRRRKHITSEYQVGGVYSIRTIKLHFLATSCIALCYCINSIHLILNYIKSILEEYLE